MAIVHFNSDVHYLQWWAARPKIVLKKIKKTLKSVDTIFKAYFLYENFNLCRSHRIITKKPLNGL
jgi:hypothetical protein